ncbi:tripartite tricarboxylate transporter substrate binding protein [Pigmentiphaga sp.]|uniref:Bug family tripartite tricarboxylate transporter substrate binding protein n=1 Tax=Pigmentiphaga sp. TaxID=1977564 RepID=UPI00128E35B6|nr:tripartite tricarboxylate transporter substrate binding protein [Pigmentiphaga sp.]MPS28594.1 tripartite tricarboxylate transporter substrate binding protein [Alcaligenaceae bacterium SAGV5]MPS54236.1 tripartite tricarboxylate transporter substrate binding protein [Alcaligenaceae bacterium SAGV3]MPT55721.1 tripartite tricarboxylate transporter substrate binding protein [Alcaligenaceae bacterium]
MNRIWTCIVLAAALALPGPGAAKSDPAAYPAKPIRLIVPYSVGGGTDILARMAGKEIAEALGQPVIVENRPSAQGIAAMEHLAHAAPDGYTLLMAPSGPLVMNPVMRKSLPYSSEKDFSPISIVGRLPLLVTVNASLPVHTVDELVGYAKANPEKVSYASSAALFQLATELFKQKTGTRFLAIPYKSSGESITALVGGQVTMAIADLPPLTALIKSGKLRALAYTNETRSEIFPDVPTVAEAGLPGIEVATLVGLIGPAGMPGEVVARLQNVLVKMVAKPDVRKRFLDIGVEPVGSTSEAYASSIRRDLERWAAVAETAGIQPE